MTNLWKMSVASGALLGALTLPGYAQNAEQGEAAAAQTYDQIVVTAQKREQNLQDVPIAVSVLDQSVIDNSFASNIEGLQTLVPSISFRKGSTSANSALSIRG